MASEKSIKYNGCKFCADCFSCPYNVCFYEMDKDEQDRLKADYTKQQEKERKATYYSRNKERILAKQREKQRAKAQAKKEGQKVEVTGNGYERHKAIVINGADKANKERKSEFIRSNLEYMERDCNKCVYHASGSCSAWKCEGTLTLEAVKKKTIDEFVERVSKHINLGAVGASDLFEIAEQYKAEV